MKTICVLLLSALLASLSFATDTEPCFPEGCRTQTQGGWGGNCNGNNPGCFRDANFGTVFPEGLTIGGNFTIHFSNSNAVRVFLPAGGTSASLTENHNDPTSTEAGVFAGQVTALALSLGFSEAGLPGFCDLGSLYYLCVPDPDRHGEDDDEECDSPFAGMTVDELFALANEVLGGNTNGLPDDTDISDLNDVITDINENFVDGTHDEGKLVCDIRLAAELSSFTAVARDGAIELIWSTASENDVERFEVERSAGESWSLTGVVNGQGDSPIGHSYRFVDESVTAATVYSYRLAEVSANGDRQILPGIVTVEAGGETALPAEFTLTQNYPNPFNPNTQISFALPFASNVTLAVFDALGRSVATLVDGLLAAGSHTVNFDAANLSNGIYFYQLKAGDFSAVRKMMLIK